LKILFIAIKNRITELSGWLMVWIAYILANSQILNQETHNTTNCCEIFYSGYMDKIFCETAIIYYFQGHFYA